MLYMNYLEYCSDCGGGLESLFDIQVAGGLVEHEDVCLLDADDCDGEPLQLPSGQVHDVVVHHMVQLQLFRKLLQPTQNIQFGM